MARLAVYGGDTAVQLEGASNQQQAMPASSKCTSASSNGALPDDRATCADQDTGIYPGATSLQLSGSPATIGASCQAATNAEACITGLGSLSLEPQPAQQPQTLQPQLFDLAAVAELIASGRARNIICMCGAGISVSAGIPDFRSPGTGLYSQLEKYQLPFPEAVFSINYFRHNPRPFYMLAKELFPGTFLPTASHLFMRLLADKGLLLRCYTQNIDALELQAGVPRGRVVAAHGSFDGAHCIDCGKPHSLYHVQAAVFDDSIATCSHCSGLVKPNIVFFGEPLPARFHRQRAMDFPQCDLLVVMGTSLVVQPFAGLIDDVPATTPRLLINRERVGERHNANHLASSNSSDSSDSEDSKNSSSGDTSGASSEGEISECKGVPPRRSGFDFSQGSSDALLLGDCDGGVRQLAQLLGWGTEMDALVQAARAEWEAAREEQC